MKVARYGGEGCSRNTEQWHYLRPTWKSVSPEILTNEGERGTKNDSQFSGLSFWVDGAHHSPRGEALWEDAVGYSVKNSTA